MTRDILWGRTVSSASLQLSEAQTQQVQCGADLFDFQVRHKSRLLFRQSSVRLRHRISISVASLQRVFLFLPIAFFPSRTSRGATAITTTATGPGHISFPTFGCGPIVDHRDYLPLRPTNLQLRFRMNRLTRASRPTSLCLRSC